MDNRSATNRYIIGMALMDENYNFTVADETVYNFFGKKPIMSFCGYIHPDDRQAFVNKIEKGFSQEENFIVCKLKGANGFFVPVIIFIKVSSAGAEGGYVLNMYDVGQLVYNYKRVEIQNSGLKNIISLMEPPYTFVYHVEEEIFEVYTDRDFMVYNDSLDKLPSFMLEKGIAEKEQIDAVYRFAEDVKTGTPNATYTLKTNLPDYGQVFALAKTGNVYRAGKVVKVVGVIKIVDEGNHKAETVEVDFDPLTGLYNRTSIKAIAENALKGEGNIVTFIMLDLDHFKEANDNYGHMFGDEVIFNAAKIIKDAVGRRGYVGRIGGDEFFIVLINAITKKEDLRDIMRTLRTQIEWAYKDKLGDVKLTASMGGATYPMDADNYNDLFMLADNALYTAKTKGRNRYVIYYKELHGNLEDIKLGDNRLNIHVHVPDSKKLEFAYLVTERLVDGTKADIEPVLKEALHYFAVNQAAIYRVSDNSVLYSAVIDNTPVVNICSYLINIKPTYKGKNFAYYGDLASLRAQYPQFYGYARANNLKSAYTYLYMGDDGRPKYYGVMLVKDKTHKWSDMEANLMGIMFKIMGKIIDRG